MFPVTSFMHTQDHFVTNAGVDPLTPVPQRYTVARGTGLEAAEVQRRLGNFDPSLSVPVYIIRQMHPGATKNELISLAQMIKHQACASYPEPPQFIGEFDRVTRMSFDFIMKLFHDNWVIVQHFVRNVLLFDANFHPISNV
jgi:hypothetical protein